MALSISSPLPQYPSDGESWGASVQRSTRYRVRDGRLSKRSQKATGRQSANSPTSKMTSKCLNEMVREALWLRTTFAVYSDVVTRQSKAYDSLDQLRQLREGWDGRNAPAIDRSILDAATQLLLAMPDVKSECHVAPTLSGGIQLEWHDTSRLLELEFESESTIHYLRWDPKNGIEDEDVIQASDLNAVRRLIRWFEDGQ